ncbi:uncharacterized protein LOC121718944 isoform X2 [Alosa sapidissima]|uniref:uncharacterized protein LOC121718944 isoform X2 n=1 Tax=Alosa sapidissima TaxID=34773 RepID=UPI001C08F923|nr:uncharacterized protein LOC121718944 isoform X2 [Alosa sapidissima]XP_041960333.1 uncharacterized protein LOC121718944 isoform X2 [Alosa sapidissima]
MDFFKCPFCDVVKFQLRKYLTHLQLLHNQQPNFNIVYNVDRCSRSYRSVACLRNHIYRKHREALQPTSSSSETTVFEQVQEDDVFDVDDEDCDEVNGRSLPTNDLDTLLSGLKQHVALFILNLQEKHLLPKVTQDTIVTNLQFVLKFFHQNYDEIIKFHLENSGFRLEDHEDLDVLLSNDRVFDSVFEYVQSDYRVLQYSKQHLHLVEPVQKVLGSNSQGGEDTFQYIPITDVLKTHLEKQDIFKSFQRTCERAPNTFLLNDFTDGEIFQGSPFYGDSSIVRLHLYTDEFEVVNPLGSKKSIHKLTAFYFTIGNLESNFTSQLSPRTEALRWREFGVPCLQSCLSPQDRGVEVA